MNTDHSAIAFPIALLAGLAALALALDRITTIPLFVPGPVKHEPDTVIENFTALSLGEDGKPIYELSARKMLHYPDDDSAELAEARMRRTITGSPVLNISADRARILDRGHEVWFDGNVVMVREPHAGDLPLTVRTSRLWANAADGLAKSDQAVTAESGHNRLSAVGFDYNNAQQIMNLHSQVKIDYAQPKR
ncbi:LPS export ABC transporter periplasmic protein LptC [Parachitinimonas caeni]|uniref:LPS export ABC transporter periplasmic protein LptC n=1 Tax=Parachitinimonas caeni TaxID=3031301 RepID=A0ABT7DSY7_9NEIS|nr:LPS export ABC transporter periplasmic protein LptC [Parachitinimonas caeni]MDK2123178.1 LPS export ABC transporter periplasmic protein LptC [Parachitinimonas caeni]